MESYLILLLPFKYHSLPLRQLAEAQQLVEAWQSNDSPGRFSPSPALFEGAPADEVMPGGRGSYVEDGTCLENRNIPSFLSKNYMKSTI